ncbi:MAG: PAS domain-containing protein [Coriobacteriia bacterium]|nr:PAS domain-containing protein [Coriobacteriia bacterium]
MSRWRSSYRVRLALGYMVIVALFAGVWGWSLAGPLKDTVIEQQQEHLQGVAQAGALAVEQAGVDLSGTVERLVAHTELRMTVVGPDGVVLADSEEDPGSMENHADRPEIAAALEGSIGRDIRESATQGVDQMYVAVPAALQGTQVVLRVSESLQRISELTAQYRSTGLALLGVALVLALAVGAHIATLAARPVERLADAATRMAAGNLSPEIPAEHGALAPLAEALGGLRTQLQDRIGALESEQANLHAVLDGLQDAVLLLEDRNVRVANRAASSLFALPPGKIEDRPLAQSGLPASIVTAIIDGLSAEKPTSSEIGPDPRGRSFRLSAVPLEGTRGLERSLVIISDITERARVDGMRRDFVSNASHELKTPTAGILLLAESARTAASDGDMEQSLVFVEQIQAEATRLRLLVQNLLDLSRLEAAPNQEAITDIRAAVGLSLAAHSRAASAKSLILKADFTEVESEDIFAAADRTDTAVALDNLLANAISYTETGEVTVAVTANVATVSITVMDTGVGIPAADLPRVFERFYRVDHSRVRDSGGTGLGLSLVRNVVERSGGNVSICSTVGEGTQVRIDLPRAR